MNRRLFDLIRQAILSGHLQAGQKLPPTRELAMELCLGRNTVLYAYERLEDEGFTVSRVGSGTYVSHTVPHAAMVQSVGRTDLASDAVQRTGRAVLSRRVQALLAAAGRADHRGGAFTPGIPDTSSFPRATWHRLMTRVWRTASAELMDHGSRGGYPPLQRAIAEHFRLARGVRCEAEQVVITQGAHHGLDLCARLLADAGDRALIEDPCCGRVRSIFSSAGLHLQPARVDRQGLDPGSFAVNDADVAPKLVFVTPSCQHPRGEIMSLARRRTLIEMAHRTGAWIIEDDRDGEFHYEGLPLPCLQGLDAHRRTVYVGGFSTSLHPGLKMGFVVLPAEMVDPFQRLQAELHRGGLLIHQATLAEFMADGHYAAHVRRMRKIYGRRRALLVSELNRQLGDGVRVVGGQAGLHVTVELTHANDALVSDAALARGIVAPCLSSYYHDRASAVHGLVLGYGCVPDDQIPMAVSTLGSAVESASVRVPA
nr:PLP-dependent aminotransferase family protein [uncultured Caldimonas sp.]